MSATNGNGGEASRLGLARAQDPDAGQTNSSTALRVDGITKDFGGKRALADVVLKVELGEIHALIGPNGAGKSTLFSITAGTLRPTRGRVFIGDADITRWSVQRRAKNGLVRAYQVARIFGSMTALENISVATLLTDTGKSRYLTKRAKATADERARELLADLSLEHIGDKAARDLSHGDRKLLEIAMVVARRPRFLLLDEPTAGMSGAETDATMHLIDRVNREFSCGVLLTEHDMRVVFETSQRVSVLTRGSLLCCGAPEEIRERDDVRDAYFGRV